MLECVLCARTFTEAQVQAGQYCLFSMVCGFCYAGLQKHVGLCFGRPQDAEKASRYGYSEKSEECTRWCPDRVACRLVVIGKQ